MPPKALTKYDYPALYQEFLELDRANTNYTLRKFHKEKKIKLEYTNLSRNFAQLGRLLAGDILAMTAPSAASSLKSLVNHKNDEMKLRASTALLDRAGHSPAAASIQINNQVNTQVNIAPLFKDDYSKNVNAFLKEDDEA